MKTSHDSPVSPDLTSRQSRFLRNTKIKPDLKFHLKAQPLQTVSRTDAS